MLGLFQTWQKTRPAVAGIFQNLGKFGGEITVNYHIFLGSPNKITWCLGKFFISPVYISNMHFLSRNYAFLVYALLEKFSLQKQRSRAIFDLFQVWTISILEIKSFAPYETLILELKCKTNILSPRTTSQFLASTAATSLATTTGPLEDAVFPKIVLCNSYQIRCRQKKQ